MYGYIYKITNLTNGLIYVGQKKLSYFDEKYWGSSALLRADIEKLGLNNFDRIVLDECENQEQLNQKEIYWIAKLNSKDPNIGYNRCNGGQSNAGFKQSEYQKSQVRKALLGKKKSAGACYKMSLAKKGKPQTQGFGTKGLVRMSFNDTKIFVKPERCNEYLESGYIFGWVEPNRSKIMKEIYTHKTYINNGEITKCVENSTLNSWLDNGWTIGRIYKQTRNNNVSCGKRNAIKIKHPDGKVKYVKFEDVESFLDLGYIPSQTYYDRLNNI